MKVGDFIGEFYRQINQNFIALIAMPPLEKVELSFLWSISVQRRLEASN